MGLLGTSWGAPGALWGGLGDKKRLMERLGVALRSPPAHPGAFLGSAWTSDPPSGAFPGSILRPSLALYNESNGEAQMYRKKRETPVGFALWRPTCGLIWDPIWRGDRGNIAGMPETILGTQVPGLQGPESPNPDPGRQKPKPVTQMNVCV